MPLVDRIEIIGPHADLYVEFVNYKRSMECKVDLGKIYMLRSISKAIEEHRRAGDDDVLPKQAVLKWIEQRGSEAMGTRHNRCSMIRNLEEYFQLQDYDTYVLPKNLLSKFTSTFQAYIFTHQEIELVANLLDSLPHDKRYPDRHIVVPMLFRTLYGCGLRLGEALRLKVYDVDIGKGVLYIRHSKCEKNCFVPMSRSLIHEFERYWELMRLDGSPLDRVIFPSPVKRNAPYMEPGIRNVLKKAYERLG